MATCFSLAHQRHCHDRGRHEARSAGRLVGRRTVRATRLPMLVNALIGTKFKPLLGYVDSAGVGMAMERGELEGYCSFTWGSIKSARPKWIEQKLINILLQLTTSKHPELPHVPLVMELCQGRRRAAGIHVRVRRSGNGTSGGGAARRSGRSRRGATARLRRYDEGQGIPRGRRPHVHRHRSDRRKGGGSSFWRASTRPRRMLLTASQKFMPDGRRRSKHERSLVLGSRGRTEIGCSARAFLLAD